MYITHNSVHRTATSFGRNDENIERIKLDYFQVRTLPVQNVGSPSCLGGLLFVVPNTSDPKCTYHQVHRSRQTVAKSRRFRAAIKQEEKARFLFDIPAWAQRKTIRSQPT